MRALVSAYVAGMIFWELGRLTPLPGAVSWYQLLDVFGVWLYLPVPALALVSIVAGAWRQLVLLMIPVLIFGAQYGAMFLPNRPPVGQLSLRITSANLLTSNTDAVSFAQALSANRPDIVLVQEIGPPMAEQAAVLLAEQYPYSAIYPSDSPLGMGIYSRYPILAAPDPRMGEADCFCQQAEVQLGVRSIRLINTHPIAPSVRFTRLGSVPIPASFVVDRQAPALQEIIRSSQLIQEPLIVAGDFNVGDRQPAYRIVSSHLRDSYREGGWGLGYTFPSPDAFMFPRVRLFPLVRIDYVFHDEDWSTRAAWTGKLAGSDHLFVVADLVLR